MHEVGGLLTCHTAVTRPIQYAVWLSWSNFLFNPVTGNMMDQGAKNKYINVQTSFVAVYTDRDGTRVAIESPRCV